MDDTHPKKTTDDEELTPDEQRLARGIFAAVYLGTIALNVMVLGANIYAGYQAWSWWLAIPIFAMGTFAARVAKRYMRNLYEKIDAELSTSEAPPETETAAEPAEPPVRKRPYLKGRTLTATFAAVMLAVATFWYLVGYGLRLWLG